MTDSVAQQACSRSPLLRADLHNHTRHSPDSSISLDDIVRACRLRGVTCLAVTDHNEISGALELASRAPAGLKIIVGEEVKSSVGEIIGYFFDDKLPTAPIPRGLSPRETADAIHELDGVVAIPHPFDRFRSSRLRAEALDEIVDEVDVIEVYNARIHLPADRDKAADFARHHDLPISAGSDAHTEGEIGNACVDMADFHDRSSFLASLRAGRIVGRQASPLVHLGSRWSRLFGGSSEDA